MRRWFVIIGVFFCVGVSAQKDKKKPPLPNYKWSASFTIAVLPLPESKVGIQPGILYTFNKRLSLLSEVTLFLGDKDDDNLEAVNKKYFRLQEELRYRFKNKWQNFYTGLRLAYASRSFDDVNGGFYTVDTKKTDQGFFYDKASINSPVFSSSIQLGTSFRAGKHLGFDGFVGIGVKFVHTDYTNVVNPSAGTRVRIIDGPLFYASYSVDGNIVGFHMNTGLRVLWHFSK